MPFPTPEIEFSRIAFEASTMAYCHAPKIQKWGEENNYAVHTFEKEECFAFIAWGDNKIIVAYRGTDDIRDWLRNADGRKVQIRDNVKVHKGFHDYMMKVGEDLSKKLNELLNQKVTKKYELIFTGHSLGAAAITNFLEEYVRPSNKVSPEKAHIHPIGSPRVVNVVLRDQLIEAYPNWYRWVNSADAIPHLPFALPKIVRIFGSFLSKPFAYFLPGGLRHVGNTCWLDVCGDLHYRPSLFFQWKDIFMGWINHIGTKGLAMIHNHFMHEYKIARDRAFWEKLDD